MGQAIIPYPDDLPRVLDLPEPSFAQDLGFLAAAKLYELGRLTASQAAALAQMDRPTFLSQLQRAGVAAINLDAEEIEAEIQAARELAG